MKVAGLPFAKAESNLRTFLSQFEDNPQFVMEPLIRLAVSGEVTRPTVFAAPSRDDHRRGHRAGRRADPDRGEQPGPHHPAARPAASRSRWS